MLSHVRPYVNVKPRDQMLSLIRVRPYVEA